jgi:hypothetical protein
MLLAAIPSALFAQADDWENLPPIEGYSGFDQEHHEEYVTDAIKELTGKAPRPDATRAELAAIVLGLLDELPAYGEKQVAMVAPPIPGWVLDGYSQLNPTCVSHSRYLDGVLGGTQAAEEDLGALYGFWCVYDAEWFSLSRHADYKAWLSAVMLHYPPAWMALSGEMEQSLHTRLVAPRQTPDEPFRELDNWINNFVSHRVAFAKPKVRDALVQELTAHGGLEGDTRFFEDTAYAGPTPTDLGLSGRHFYLLAALSLEFFQEIYAAAPATKQLNHFRDYFISTFNYNAQ